MGEKPLPKNIYRVSDLPDSIQERIAAEDDGCWIWTGGRTSAGYGALRWGEPRRPEYAHRLVYELLVGPIPEGLVIDHFACSNPPCVNPVHLRPVTTQENILRSNSMAARWAGRTHCAEGHPLDGVSRGVRYCKTCNRIKASAHYYAKREASRA